MKRTFQVTGILMLLAVCGCSGVRSEQRIDMRISSEYLGRIDAGQWVLQEMTVDGRAVELTGRPPTIAFEADGRVFGFASVNRYFGSVQITDRGELSWSDGFGTTKMGGPPEAMKQESDFLNALPNTQRITLDNNTLIAASNDHTTQLIFTAAQP